MTMNVESRREEPVVPIRHRLAVRPVLVSSSVLPKFARQLDQNHNVVPQNGSCKQEKQEKQEKEEKQEKQGKYELCKDRHNRHKAHNKHENSKHNKHEHAGHKHKKQETKQPAVNSSKKDTLFMVQIPYGPLLKVPAGKSYYRVQHDGYKYSLLIDPATGYLRHVHKRPI